MWDQRVLQHMLIPRGVLQHVALPRPQEIARRWALREEQLIRERDQWLLAHDQVDAAARGRLAMLQDVFDMLWDVGMRVDGSYSD